MTFEFKFPDVGEGIHEGEIVRWRVNVGDTVKEDQPLVEVETAKAIVELPSPRHGKVIARHGKEGDVIHVGALLVEIEEEGVGNGEEGTGNGKQGIGENHVGQVVAEEAPGVIGKIPTEMKGVVLPPRTASGGIKKGAQTGPPRTLPKVRALAQQLGIDLSKITGTGPGGQVTESDVRREQGMGNGEWGTGGRQQRGVEDADFAKWGPIEKIPLKGIRKAVAEHMARSAATIPHVTHIDEFDATNLIKIRSADKQSAEKQGVKLTYLPYIIKAVAAALKKHPSLNAAFDEAGQTIVYKKYYNIGIAVDTPEGLMVPVIKDADKKEPLAIAREIADLAQRCRERRITQAELEGATFSITNVGSIGGIAATPIIATGQSAILALMRMREEPVVISKKVEVRPIMKLALSYDHRVLDGADGARFMNAVIETLQENQDI